MSVIQYKAEKFGLQIHMLNLTLHEDDMVRSTKLK